MIKERHFTTHQVSCKIGQLDRLSQNVTISLEASVLGQLFNQLLFWRFLGHANLVLPPLNKPPDKVCWQFEIELWFEAWFRQDLPINRSLTKQLSLTLDLNSHSHQVCKCEMILVLLKSLTYYGKSWCLLWWQFFHVATSIILALRKITFMVYSDLQF